MTPNAVVIQEIKNIPWFYELNSSQVEKLADIAWLKFVSTGDELFKEGDRPDCLYIILDGEVILENYIPSAGTHFLAKAEPLDVVGWSSMTPIVRQRSVTARVCRPTRVLTIRGEALFRLCEADHDLGFLVMRRIANIVATHYLNSRLHLYDLIRNSSTPSLSQSNLF
jgi:CRP-like cAMP-binding protein